MTQKQIENQIKAIIFKHISPREYKIFVYGSRATGRARKWSDWDIGVIGKKHLPPLAISAIEEELENSLDIPYNVDVVDFSQVSEEFKQVALQTIVPWTK